MAAFTKLSHALRLGINPQRFFHGMRERHGNSFIVSMPGLNQVMFTSDTELVSQIFQADSATLSSSLPSPLEPLLGTGSLILLQASAHEQERRQLKPLFQGECLHQYNQYIQSAISAALATLPAQTEAQAFTRQVTLDVILRAVFGIESPHQRSIFSNAILRLLAGFNSLLLLVPQSRFPLFGAGPWDRFLRARQQLDALIFAEINRRIQDDNCDGDHQNDILGHLIRQQQNEQQLDQQQLHGQQPDQQQLHRPHLRRPQALPQATMNHLRDQLTTLLLAGHETTANTLAWALYYLATLPTSQCEIRQQLTGDASIATAELARSAMKSDCLDAFCSEVLRLRPVVPLVIRSVLQPFQLGDHWLAPGTYAGVATFNLHTDPALYPDPLRFDPQRFLHKKFKSSEYVPFGGGNKKCLGYGFALHEMKIILANLLVQYEIRLQGSLQPTASIQGLVMGPKQKIRLEMIRLNSATSGVSSGLRN